MKLTLVLGNQLFDTKYFKDLPRNVFMAEDFELCTHFKYHKHKIIHFLASMRIFSQELKSQGFNISYYDLLDKRSYSEKLERFICDNEVKEIHLFEVEDKFFEKYLAVLLRALNIKVLVHRTPMFICQRNEFKNFISRYKKPLLNNFYIEMRKKHNILMENQKPIGGEWNSVSYTHLTLPTMYSV